MALDDLLRYDEEPARKTRPRLRFPPTRVVATIVVCVGLSWAILAFLRALGFAAPFALVFAVLLSTATLFALVQEVGSRPLPDTMKSGPEPRRGPDPDDDGLLGAVRRWEMRLDWTGREGHRFSTATQPSIVDIIDERLRVRHGIDRHSDPNRARELLGPNLHKFVTEPVKRRMSGPELAALASEMEDL